MVENQFYWKLKCLGLGNSGEFQSDEFVKFCQQRGITRELTTAYNLKQNGFVEKMN